jgi:hypothetical protein
VSRDDRKIDEILAGGYLAGPEYDRILDRVLDATAPRRRRRIRWMLVPGGPLALAATLAAWWLYVRPAPGPFTAKGRGADGAAGALEVGCARVLGRVSGPAGTRACKIGDTLLFQVNAAMVAGYLGAHAERADAPGGLRIWYFPTATGESPRVAPGTGTVVVPDGIAIGPEHAAGRYRVTVWISGKPLARSEVDKAAPSLFIARGTFDVQIAD